MSNKGGPAQERKSEILDELKEIRTHQGNIKQERQKLREQLDSIQERIQKKVRLSSPPGYFAVLRTYSLNVGEGA